MKISFTFIEVFADVSMNSKLLSSAYDWASFRNKTQMKTTDRNRTVSAWWLHYVTFTWKSTALLLARSALFPDSAITMFGLACLWSSLTQFFALANDSWRIKKGTIVNITTLKWQKFGCNVFKHAYLVGDVINYNGGLGTSVVHGGQTVVALLSGRVPYLKLYRCVIQAHCLR